MIAGVVNANLEATMALRVRSRRGRPAPITAVIDTGFDGWLTLPAALVSRLGLPQIGREAGVLADGSAVFFNIHRATIIWDGRPRPVPAAVAGGAPLVGMSLLEGYEVTIEVRDGGSVRIAALGVP